MVNENQTNGASGSPEAQAPTADPATVPVPVTPEAKVEVKDGKVLVDGKSFVAESDLIAAKRSLEGQLEKQQTAHEGAIDSAKLDVSNALQQVAQLNAKIQGNEQARQAGAVSEEDAARVKQEVETAKSSLEQANARVLELRRANIVLTSQGAVSSEQLEGKTLEQLDSFVEALNALSTSKGGLGAYATGGGQGGAAPKTEMDRAGEVLANTPVRGVRTADTQ